MPSVICPLQHLSFLAQETKKKTKLPYWSQMNCRFMWDGTITVQLHSFHMPARLCSKSFKLGFSNMWIENFQMYTLDLEKGEPEIKSSISTGSWRKQGNSRKTSTSASLTMLKSLTVWITTNWKVLKEMGIPDHLTCLLRNLYAGQEATVRTRHGTMDWFQIGKRVCQGCILSLCLFNLYAEYIMWNAGLMKC